MLARWLILIVLLIAVFAGAAAVLALIATIILVSFLIAAANGSPRPADTRLAPAAMVSLWLREIVSTWLVILVFMPFERWMMRRDVAASAEEAARSYNRMCMDFLKEQIRFKKTGTYLINDAAIANEEVYSKPDVMRYYMIGLLLSYMFWPNHYTMLRFLDDHQMDAWTVLGVGLDVLTE